MHYFASAQVPTLSQLAQKFAVCDHWFVSAPCQTWPNRWFVHAATADGHVNNDPPHLPDVPTIFNRLEQAGIDNWKIYFHDFAQAHTLLQLFLLGSHFQSYRQFQADCQTGQLPAYSFIEPQYFADFGHPENDQHPFSPFHFGNSAIGLGLARPGATLVHKGQRFWIAHVACFKTVKLEASILRCVSLSRECPHQETARALETLGVDLLEKASNSTCYKSN
jgi:hypothetical protein